MRSVSTTPPIFATRSRSAPSSRRPPWRRMAAASSPRPAWSSDPTSNRFRIGATGAMADEDEDEELELEPQPDEASGLDVYRADCERAPDQFAQRHGRAFLLMQRAGDRRLTRPRRFSSTLVSNKPPAIARELNPSRYLVFPVRKTARSTIQRFYSVGQTRNNDIVIRDATVSKFHAFFE